MPRQHFLHVDDPRDPARCLGVYFVILTPGLKPDDTGPGSNPEIEIRSARDALGVPAVLTDDQADAVIAEIVGRFDFRQAERDARDAARELYCLEGVL